MPRTPGPASLLAPSRQRQAVQCSHALQREGLPEANAARRRTRPAVRTQTQHSALSVSTPAESNDVHSSDRLTLEIEKGSADVGNGKGGNGNGNPSGNGDNGNGGTGNGRQHGSARPAAADGARGPPVGEWAGGSNGTASNRAGAAGSGAPHAPAAGGVPAAAPHPQQPRTWAPPAPGRVASPRVGPQATSPAPQGQGLQAPTGSSAVTNPTWRIQTWLPQSGSPKSSVPLKPQQGGAFAGRSIHVPSQNPTPKAASHGRRAPPAAAAQRSPAPSQSRPPAQTGPPQPPVGASGAHGAAGARARPPSQPPRAAGVIIDGDSPSRAGSAAEMTRTLEALVASSKSGQRLGPLRPRDVQLPLQPYREAPGWDKNDYYYSSLTPEALDFFDRRGITAEVLRRNRIYCERTFCPQKGEQRVAIAFPYFKHGQLVHVKYRLPDPSEEVVWSNLNSAPQQQQQLVEERPELVMYGFDDAKQWSTVVIVEDELDKLALEVAEFPNVVSVPNGGATGEISKHNFSYMDSFMDLFDEARLGDPLGGGSGAAQAVFLLALRDHEPGRRLRAELLRRLGRERCYRVHWDAASTDLKLAAARPGADPANDDGRRRGAAEVLVKDGPGALQGCVRGCVGCGLDGLGTFHDVEDQLIAAFNMTDPGVMPKSTGWPCLDPYYKVALGELTIVTGYPGQGKSEWLDALLVNLAENYGWRFLLCSLEKLPDQHMQALVEKRARKPFYDHKRFSSSEGGVEVVQRMSPAELTVASAFISGHFLTLRPSEVEGQADTGPSVEWILEMARVAVLRYGISGLVIDPYNMLHNPSLANSDRDKETDYISRMLSQLKAFAKQYDVHIWFVAHPRAPTSSDGRQRQAALAAVPTAYDISGSAHWNNKADNVIAVHRRPGAAGVTDIHLQKVRDGERVGCQGAAWLLYDRATGRYTDPDPPSAARELSRVDRMSQMLDYTPPPVPRAEELLAPEPAKPAKPPKAGRLPEARPVDSARQPGPEPLPQPQPEPREAQRSQPSVAQPRAVRQPPENACDVAVGWGTKSGGTGRKSAPKGRAPGAKEERARQLRTRQAAPSTSGVDSQWQALAALAAAQPDTGLAERASRNNSKMGWHTEPQGDEEEGEEAGARGRRPVKARRPGTNATVQVMKDGVWIAKEREAPESLAQSLTDNELRKD